MQKLEAIVFDCDGIVVDSDDLQSQAEQVTAGSFAEEHGLVYDETNVDWGAMRGWARRKIAAKIFGIEVESELAEVFRLAVVDNSIDIMTSENVRLIDDVTQFAQYMAMHGLKLGLATSSHRRIYSQYCSVNEMDFFPPAYIVTHGEALDNKPQAGPYLEVMKRMGVVPEQSAVIDDFDTGIMAGRNARATVLSMPTTLPMEYLRSQTGAHMVAEDFRHAAWMLQPRLPR